ncbi:MAG: methyltransferase domain-containing protein [Candidatus Bathyarchaeia archaeon]
MTQKIAEEFSASCLFFFASLLTGLVSVMALSFVWAKQRAEKQLEPQKTAGFLANEQRALNFYKIFSFAYDILNPYLYTDAMRSEIVNQIENGANQRVLDVGCGTGYTTSGVLKRKDVSEVVGLDMNPVQLKRAVKNLHSEKGRTLISRGDADNLPFIDSSFDAVISVGAVEYFQDPEKTVKELTRVARPGGTVIVGGPESRWFSKFALNRVFYTPSPEEMESIFGKADLVRVKSHLTGVKTFFGTNKYVVFAVGKKPESPR